MEWVILIGYGLLLWFISPWSQDESMFFRGRDRDGEPAGLWLLTGSIFVTWIFAKSITNASNLGATFGIVGGLAYAAWYVSIPVAGLVIYGIRRRGNVDSLAEFLATKYGRLATLAFMLAIFIRLFNEIWSNTMVVGTYFGAKGSNPYYFACFVFTVITLAYSLRGGLRSSLVTDGIQVILMVFFIGLVMFFIVPARSGSLVTTGELSMSGGLDLLLVGLLQALSYPFHDPVLTDRGFLSGRKTTLKSYLTAGVLGGLCIMVFSLVGVYAFVEGLEIMDDAPPQVAQSLGTSVLVMMNVIMLTSAGSTIDSTFSSLAREWAVDLPTLSQWYEANNVQIGRMIMVAMAILGNLPLFSGATILQATTISGTMVMGLAPIFLFFWWERPGPLSFHLAFWTGLGIGIYSTLVSALPEWIQIGGGQYAGLLGINLYGLLICFVLYSLGAFVPLSSNQTSSVSIPPVKK